MRPRLNKLVKDVTLVASPLAESNIANVDGNQQRLRDLPLVSVGQIDSACGWHHDPVDVAIIVGVIETSAAAKNVHRVLVSPWQTVLTKVRNLFSRMTGNVLGKRHF